MSQLKFEYRNIFVLFIALTLFGFLVAVVFFYEVRNCESKVIVKVAEKNERLKRPAANFLIDYSDGTVADQLARKVRVLCWVMTHPKNHHLLQGIKATWGKRCNKLLFMTTSGANITAQITALPVQEGEEYLWGKTKAAFKYVYERHRDDADWFMKVDDDTYVIVENLRYMLADHDSDMPIYFGCRFKHKNQSYMSGGAGYVLSRAALDKLIHQGLAGPTHCRVYEHGDEDFEMGKCLKKIGVTAGDSRDSLRRGRFFPFPVSDHLFPNQDKKFWYWNYVYYPTKDGLDCCSEYAISFHYIEHEKMYVLDYLIYKLRPYGIEYKTGKKPKILNETSENKTKANTKFDPKHKMRNIKTKNKIAKLSTTISSQYDTT